MFTQIASKIMWGENIVCFISTQSFIRITSVLFLYLRGCVTNRKESFLLLESLTLANLLDIK